MSTVNVFASPLGRKVKIVLLRRTTTTHERIPQRAYTDDAKAIFEALRSNLPSGTYAELAKLFAEDVKP